MDQVIYELKNPFEYARKGEQEKAQFIELTAPSFKQLQYHSPIEQAFAQAVGEIAETVSESDGGDDGELTGGAVLQVLLRWSGDVNKVYIAAQELFKQIAKIDGETRLTVPLMEKMHVDDYKALVGEYIANFIVPSLMDGT